MPLYRDDLDAPPTPRPHGDASTGDVSRGDVSRSVASTGDLWFHAKCHLDSPTWARYRDGVLTIQCARCERDVVALAIARRPGATGPDRMGPEGMGPEGGPASV